MDDFYTYAYLRIDGTPYYVGKGRGKRACDGRGHRVKVPNKDRILFLKKNLTEEEAFRHEIYMIAVLGRKDQGTGILRNLTDGGEGHVNPSPEARKRNSESSKLQYKQGVGLGGLTEEQEERRKTNAAIASREWRLKNNHNGGALGRSLEKHSEDSARAIEKGCAQYWKSLPEEERLEKRREIGRKGGLTNKEKGIGICGLSFEERSEISKRKFNDPETVEAYRERGRNLYSEGKGLGDPSVREKARLINLERTSKEFHVKSPEGIVYKGKGRKPFAREHGLPTSSFNDLVRGRRDECFGWTRVEG